MSYGRRGYGLGQALTCLGYTAVGGSWTPGTDGHSLIITPDDNPGEKITLIDPPAYAPEQQTTIAGLIRTYSGRRTAFSGYLLSDGRMVSDGGAGSLSANEFYRRRELDPAQCVGVRAQAMGIPGPAPAPPPGATPPPPATPPPAPPSWTGEQIATVQVTGAGIPENATLYGADGRTYKIAAGSEASAAIWLATYAPQGPALVVKGAWDPGAGLVVVQDAYIQATGSRGYGVMPTGEMGPPSTDYPSSTPEGTGLMPRTPEAAPGAPGAPAPSTAGAAPGGVALWILGGLAVALMASQRRGRR